MKPYFSLLLKAIYIYIYAKTEGMNTFKTKRVGEGQLDRFNVPLLIIIKEEH
jgi:hypothetical protein